MWVIDCGVFFCRSSVKRSALLFKYWKAYTVKLLICTYCVLMFLNLTSQMAATVRWCPICSSQPSGVHLSCPTATEPATPNSTGEMVSPGLCLALVINSALSAPLQSVSVIQVWMAVLQQPVKIKDCVFFKLKNILCSSQAFLNRWLNLLKVAFPFFKAPVNYTRSSFFPSSCLLRKCPKDKMGAPWVDV